VDDKVEDLAVERGVNRGYN